MTGSAKESDDLRLVAVEQSHEIHLGSIDSAKKEKRMPKIRRLKNILLAVVVVSLSLSACSSAPDVVGVWIAPDGASAFINEDGSCAGMYYNNGQPLDIGGPMTCAFSGSTLVVSQPPNQATYDVSLSGDSMTLTSGGTNVTFTRG